ncbi:MULTISPECIES: hypothetical protein [Pseudomonas]|uniref:Uncharacterized protein n=1 Tax=Pseudomonas gessardii TaxID=78544 RepID=A0A7Y1MPP6_9PSED|nr:MULTISPECIES: hypothetical protein [Pseudomonas]MBH3425245.1 hypothetical protein [Pseudomonas gessardii]MCF4977687.1 hypothetical protein [Pseudomonas gessardii]MCF4989979.1 hypothetical protein [Pseudomonas gessardii]MCF5084205.1 hypothetical protein [Pseudomonas gessardii]MCF5094272.1 hypothetical protein [Pseudomonas gessardii]
MVSLDQLAFQPNLSGPLLPESRRDPGQYEHLWQKHGRDMEPYSAAEQRIFNSGRFNRLTLDADSPAEEALKAKMGRNDLRMQLGVSSKNPPTPFVDISRAPFQRPFPVTGDPYRG